MSAATGAAVGSPLSPPYRSDVCRELCALVATYIVQSVWQTALSSRCGGRPSRLRTNPTDATMYRMPSSSGLHRAAVPTTAKAKRATSDFGKSCQNDQFPPAIGSFDIRDA